ncbi:hypothetical protein GGQ85_002097, partial [Nitrobacter vulgaris]|nr:hypothetical protein [Nitrobacter vulgaris]
MSISTLDQTADLLLAAVQIAIYALFVVSLFETRRTSVQHKLYPGVRRATLSKRHHARISYAAIAGIALLIGASGPLYAQGHPQDPTVVTAPNFSPGAHASPPQASLPSPSSASGPSSTEAAPSPAGDAGANLLEQASPHDLSPWSMFMSADIVVKLVMIGLAFASLVTWTICIAKMVELSLARRKLGAALTEVSGSRSLAEAQMALGAKDGVLASLLASAMHEARL